jgi:hypothetical protein
MNPRLEAIAALAKANIANERIQKTIELKKKQEEEARYAKLLAEKIAQLEAEKEALSAKQAQERDAIQKSINAGLKVDKENQFLPTVSKIKVDTLKKLQALGLRKWVKCVGDVIWNVLEKNINSIYSDQDKRAETILLKMRKNHQTTLYLMDGIGRFLSLIIKKAIAMKMRIKIILVGLDKSRHEFHKEFITSISEDGLSIEFLNEDICNIAERASAKEFVYGNFCSLPSDTVERNRVIELTKHGRFGMISFTKMNSKNQDGSLTTKGMFIKWLEENSTLTDRLNRPLCRGMFASYLF